MTFPDFLKSRRGLWACFGVIGLLLAAVFVFARSAAPGADRAGDSIGIFNFNGSGDPTANPGELPIAAAALRRELPDNLYWQAVARPRDDAEKKAQHELHEHWATLYGKIYSGRATRAEIDEYYAAQMRLQTDQLEVLRHLEERYSDELGPDKRRLLAAGKLEYQRRLEKIQAQYKMKLDEIQE